MSLSKRAQYFQDLLADRGLQMEVLELPASTRTADDAARTLGCQKAQIVKSLVFRSLADNRPVVVLASGPNRVNEVAISELIGAQIVKGDADFVKETTGFAIGGVPPLGHREEVALLVDEDLLQFDELWAAAGTPSAVFKITGRFTDVLPAHRVVSVK
ncbi:YbaK/EbsC family protein [Burkholderia cenocepacia]|uniref:YbaK/EbsC family protein n=1 Tax=Burkholderia cenocepacia TaxID=95486 RepID=UPI000F574CC8|nr:YbaK/EbsC family protein [Burkholderia cenocepacia]RQV35413.1 YbaK/EbsC family protein [Burkholderia cenocepacia]RQV37000.1 YbaK/EbsC family protein [Burkholderia cenocepacia]RQV73640.1 YbaK/EbsC family protein [Burkholderia cenocepacia]